jgi:hypothetical protein
MSLQESGMNPITACLAIACVVGGAIPAAMDDPAAIGTRRIAPENASVSAAQRPFTQQKTFRKATDS